MLDAGREIVHTDDSRANEVKVCSKNGWSAQSLLSCIPGERCATFLFNGGVLPMGIIEQVMHAAFGMS